MEVLFSPIMTLSEVTFLQEIEIEFKNNLTKTEYTFLKRKWFLNEQPITQINHYFETNDFQLKEKGAALRIREKNNFFVATLKEDKSNYLLETHLPLSKKEYLAWIKGHIFIKDALQERLTELNININELNYRGYLMTHRLQLVKDQMTIVLDRSVYNGLEDYEIELEADDEQVGKAYFQKLLLENNIEIKPTKNKIERFFETL